MLAKLKLMRKSIRLRENSLTKSSGTYLYVQYVKNVIIFNRLHSFFIGFTGLFKKNAAVFCLWR
jgi:hypothetical protein